jgi:hypothetical protein
LPIAFFAFWGLVGEARLPPMSELAPTAWLALTAIAVGTSIVSGVMGLAGGMLLLAAMLHWMDPLVAIPIHGIVQLASNASRAWFQRANVRWDVVWRFAWPLLPAGAVGLWLLGPWVVRFVYKPEYVPIATAVLPWYAAAMLPYCLANVLVNNLLARSDFRIVPVLVAIAIGYAITISFVHSTFVIVLQILGAFNLLLLIGAILFTRRTTRSGGVTPTAISGVSA